MAQHGPGVALLLAQVGAEASQRFAEAIKPLGLTPPQAGLLRLLARRPDCSQRELATLLSVAPSRVVSYLDDLERRGVVVRRQSSDRRVNLVNLTAEGTHLMGRLRTAAKEHDASVTSALTAEQVADLRAQLSVIADYLGLESGVHPGYRDR